MTNLEFRLKTVDETRNYYLEEIKHDYLIRENHKKGFVGIEITATIFLLLFVLSVVVFEFLHLLR